MMTPKKYSSPFRFINQQLNVEELDIFLMIRDIDESCRRSTFRVLGSCHGLILINIHKHIYLWNPSTRFYTKVLELDDNLMDLGLYYTCGGLCFDTSKNVYKVVLIMSNPHYYHDDDDRQVVIVASLEDKKWRQVEFPYDMPYVLDGITLHGQIHCRIRLSRDDHYNIKEGKWNCFGRHDEIICFDPINEKFHVFFVLEPKSDETIMLGLGTLNECLCMSLLDNYDKSYVEILVMKEYGVNESWTSLFLIRNLEFDPGHGAIMPLFMTKNGELTLMMIKNIYEENILVYNPKNDNVQEIHLVNGRKDCISYTFCYEESLISLKSEF